MRAEMTYEAITLEFDGPIARLTLNDPSTLNAISPLMIKELNKAADEIADPKSGARCVLWTGQGRGFCSGANLGGGSAANAGAGGSGGDLDAGAVLDAAYHPFLRKLRNLDMPIVNAINGIAAGAGMSFALSGDIILAAKSASFLQAFSRIGLVPDAGSTYLLPRKIGVARAMELSLLAEKLPAEKALDWGLINSVHDDDKLMEEAEKIAQKLASGPTVAYARIRKLYRDSFENSFEEQIGAERLYQKECGRSHDFIEGVTAFLQKRTAKYTGK
jgi:2-(1,2-epoxy-1,2-dihydrophenyl)acetyl-CoA isomerase